MVDVTLIDAYKEVINSILKHCSELKGTIPPNDFNQIISKNTDLESNTNKFYIIKSNIPNAASLGFNIYFIEIYKVAYKEGKRYKIKKRGYNKSKGSSDFVLFRGSRSPSRVGYGVPQFLLFRSL